MRAGATACHHHRDGSRVPKDLDLLVGIDEANRERLAAALALFGAPANVVSGARNLTPREVVYFGVSPLRVDILASASGIERAADLPAPRQDLGRGLGADEVSMAANQ